MTISSLAHKKCFITGAASGIGRATARAAARKGAVLLLTDLDAEGLDDAAREIRDAGGRVALHAAIDLCDLAAVRDLAREIHEVHGPMDVVMNIAGVSVWGTVDVLEHKHWQRAIDVNLMGPIHVIETFVPEMIRGGGGGHLVNVSSAAGLLGLPWHAAYSASKFGLRGISEVLRFDLARHGIGVSLVCPGAVDTGLVQTIDIPGIDMSHEEVVEMKARFRDDAITPDQAAAAIIRGVEKNRYLVFTSLDIRAAHWLQRFVPPAYRLLMRRLNDMLHRVGSKARSGAKSGARSGAKSGSSSGVMALALLAGLAIACGGGSAAVDTGETGTGGAADTGSGEGDTAGANAGDAATAAAEDDAATTGRGESGADSTATADAGSESTGTGGGTEAVTLDRFVCPGASLGEGMNTFDVGDRTRSVYLQFPSDMSGPIGVVFSWHGYNDPGSDGDSAGWRSAARVDADADPALPVVVVTPIDVDFDPPVGLDWQLDEGTAAGNVDLALFEATLGCLNEQYDLDAERIYSYGFSAGSVMTSLVHSAYPDIVHTVVCVSGMWFNDPAQVEMINLIPVDPSWPALDPGDGGTVLLTHGGPSDVTFLGIANLEDMAQAAFPFLAAAERVVVDCGHQAGHTLHPELTTENVMTFFSSHRAAEPSPYVDEGLSGFPASCSLRLP